jgi:hypothetical protein
LVLTEGIVNHTSYEENCFTFLNLKKNFKEKIDWNYEQHGKLWTYNLNYFEFLHQENIHTIDALYLINDFIQNDSTLKEGKESFPISLRGLNWIKFLSNRNIHKKTINNALYRDYQQLMNNIEYHLLGNHLLENAFSLLFAAYFFKEETFYQKSLELLKAELNEQILKDGAHFELSPMYHQLMLYRILDAINLVKNNPWKNHELLDFLLEKSKKMLNWMQLIIYQNGDIPLLNDSANNIAPTSMALFEYAKRMEIEISTEKNFSNLSDSGYRKFSNDRYECIVDIGEIGPSYIPGHAHADTFNFELRIDKQPFIVDSGISTYENNTIRTYQRGSMAHNTVNINKRNSSETWSSFRVANRAKIVHLQEQHASIKATHNGYEKKFHIQHTREWLFESSKVSIQDTLSKSNPAKAMLHFHPNITEEKIKQHIEIKEHYLLKNYDFASEYNQLSNALMLEIPFEETLLMEIQL